MVAGIGALVPIGASEEAESLPVPEPAVAEVIEGEAPVQRPTTTSANDDSLRNAWRQFIDGHGRHEAERIAGIAVDRVAQVAGNRKLDALVRQRLIDVVLAGDGGPNPDEASDIMQLNVDVVSGKKLTKLIDTIQEQ